uniref:Uncharacterized protein n=2 Tax=Anguilla anguilla TaxID=7936 RepID=A0A0E9RF55_ANGAN
MGTLSTSGQVWFYKPVSVCFPAFLAWSVVRGSVPDWDCILQRRAYIACVDGTSSVSRTPNLLQATQSKKLPVR